MKLEDQVCSLELAKRLKELGVKQESLFYWDEEGHYVWRDEELQDATGKFHVENCWSAFTVAELIDLLGDKFGVLERFPHSGKFGAYIPNDIGVSATGDKVADVLAQLLLEVYETIDPKREVKNE